MQINLTGHHIDITPSVREYVNTKIQRVQRHYDNLTDMHVILRVEKKRHKAECALNVSGARLFADAVETDMYAAIDSLADKLDRQVKKHKEKVTDHHARDVLKSRQA